MAKTKQIGSAAMFFYILGCIASGGSLWMMKVVIEKAICDSR